MKTGKIYLGVLLGALMLWGSGCDFLNYLDTPLDTKAKMLGVWEVTAAMDENEASLLKNISFPVTSFQLADANSVNSTGGPMFMNIVYGNNKYTEIASKVDEVFNYSNLTLTEGEWFIETGYPDRFTLEMKLQGIPGQTTMVTLLSLLGITSKYLDATVYHKFINVEVTFPEVSDSVMVWKFDDQTTAVYNTKDSQGNYVFWNGWPTTSFGHYTFYLTKRVETVQQLIQGN
jgi:hypothetical protein